MPASSTSRTGSGRFAPGPPRRTCYDELFALWSVATAEANLAYDAWSSAPGGRTYAVFLAADDRASAAQDALACFLG